MSKENSDKKDHRSGRFNDNMTPADLNRWLKYVKARSMSFQIEKELESDVKELMETWNDINNYNGPKKMNGAWEQNYWNSLVKLDFLFVSLQEKHRNLIRKRSS